ncbi:DUF3440 domain-containing protein [Carnobacteriaceae bacterium zg-ZUI240]|nr:DUF3440 domain-containing protein [Carnobacteriaceae bacterium zg-ZUI240]
MNVYEASMKRIDFIFNEFDDVYLSFSGGKDSGATFNLLADYCKANQKKFSVLFVDMEGAYKNTVDFVKEMIDEHRSVLNDVHWVCLPFYGDNASSNIEPIWHFWDTNKKDKWIREMPTEKYVINIDNYKAIFGELNLNLRFSQFVDWYGKWRAKKYGKTANFMGIRTQESLNRWRALNREDVNRYCDKQYTVDRKNGVVNVYPIFDWSVEDIWIYNGKFNKRYNKTYDLYWRAGVPLSAMRIDEPFGVEERNGIMLWKELEPQTWSKMVERVKGVNLSVLGFGTKAIGQINDVTLPSGHTWKSYLDFLMDTLPLSTKEMYQAKFDRFIEYWKTEGSVLSEHELNILKETQNDFYNFTEITQNRGDKKKHKVIAKVIPDENPNNIKSLSYKRMVLAILKGDIFGKTLSFGVSKKQIEMRNNLVKQYKEML